MFRSVIRKLTKKDTAIKLGRWAIKPEDSSITKINAVLNAADHCGDHICGEPKLVNDLIKDTNLYKIKEDADYCCMLLGLNSCNNCSLISQKINS
jgi:hypothetical protein